MLNICMAGHAQSAETCYECKGCYSPSTGFLLAGCLLFGLQSLKWSAGVGFMVSGCLPGNFGMLRAFTQLRHTGPF